MESVVGVLPRRMPSSAVTSAPEGSVEIFTETFSPSAGGGGGGSADGSAVVAGADLVSASGSGGTVATSFCRSLWREPTTTAPPAMVRATAAAAAIQEKVRRGLTGKRRTELTPV